MRVILTVLFFCLLGLFVAPSALPTRDAVSPPDPCWIGIMMYTHDDLRAGSAAFALMRVEFWRGGVVAGRMAPAGHGIPGRAGRWRFPAPPVVFNDAVRRIVLSYRLDPGDGLLLQPDTWNFSALKIRHYCDDGPVQNDDFFNSPDTGPNLELSPSMRNAIGPLRGEGTITIYEGADPLVCTSDRACSDSIFCNGMEQCRPGAAGSDFRGCHSGTPVTCGKGETCSEHGTDGRGAGECVPNACLDPDKDGDGFAAIACGGNDCDDQNRTVYSGHSDRWDSLNRNQDCDPLTNGARGFFHAEQICDGEHGVILIPESGDLTRAACTSGSVCVPQPSGAGICAGRPDGYIAPPQFTAPLKQTEYADQQPRRLRPLEPSSPPIRNRPLIPRKG
jgi:hypothetical protein